MRKDLPLLAGILNRALADIDRDELRVIHKSWVGELKEAELGLTYAERAWLDHHPVIRVSSEADYAPFDYRIAGKPAGYSVELVEILADRIGVELEFVKDSWSNMLGMAKRGEIDLLHSVFDYPSERKRYLKFTRPYKGVVNVIVTRSELTHIDELRELKDLRVAVVKDDSLIVALKGVVDDQQLVYFDSYSDAFNSVAAGKTDATLTELPTATHLINELYLNNLVITAKSDALGGRDQRYRLAVRNDWPMLASILDKALDSLSVAELRRLDAKWLKLPEPPRQRASQLALSAREKGWIDKHPVVSIAFDENYPPYSFRNEKGEFVGIAVDFARELAQRAGFYFEPYEEGTWKKLYMAAEKRDVDVIATLVKRKEREELFAFTRPYVSLAQYIVTRKEDLGVITRPEDLSGRRMALVKGYSMSDVLLEEIEGIEPLYVMNLNEGLEAVSAGKADATIGAIGMAHHLITQAGLPNLGFATLYSKGQSEQRFGVRKDWPELATILGKALDSLSDEEVLAIFGNWTRPEIARTEAELTESRVALTEEERAWLETHPVIRVHNEQNWAPFNFIEKGRPKGYSIDYMNLLASKLGIEVEYLSGPSWDDFLSMMKRNELDVMLNIVDTEDRRDYINFTDSYLRSLTGIYVRQDEPLITSLEALEGNTVALPSGFFEQELIERYYPNIKMHLVKDNLLALQAVMLGEADAAIGEPAVMNHLMLEQSIFNIRLSGSISDPRFDNVLNLGVRKDWPTLRTILQKAMDSVAYQERQHLRERWLPQAAAKLTQRIDLSAEEIAWLKAHPVIRVSNELDWPPYDYNVAGRPTGFSIDYLHMLADKVGVELEFVTDSWAALMERFKRGEIDLIHPLHYSNERAEIMHFTKPFFTLSCVAVVRKEDDEITSLKQLYGKTLAGADDWALTNYIREHH
ncbi:transporter substrate-binding domain-containing protein [Candidatus Reidiella endopervernicosa]|uniref:Transporter substrate-binding domain-containing protein n=1 Tax=Candidatus Reidiella endopervernicosa TaxID=2738883 RepID=A0A6N0HWF3_9GAMM|nr:transporter substrate-binding domain-containing protein [Candidatus Reidiella endopervernicosa]QKQ26684.1 transporter substrate-binding domain-containing protein [Candidatus Reidiella endopervernicosa]